MSDTVSTTTTIRGIEVEVLSELDFRYEDDSFSHEFGTERCGHWEVEMIYPVELDGSPRQNIEAELEARGKATKRNSPYKKYVRQLEREIARHVAELDPDEFWDGSQRRINAINEACSNHEEPEPEPDYDYADRERD